MIEKKYGFIEKVAVLSVALLMYTTSMTTPALGEISKAFPNASSELVKQIASLPSLMMVAFSLVAGQLERFMSKKKILCIAMLFQFVGGMLPIFANSITFILVTRVIFGVGYGLLFPLSTPLLADMFQGDEFKRLLGYKASIGAIAGVVFQMLGGFLAAINWRYSFLGFLLMIPICLLIILKLPDIGDKKVSGDKNDTSKSKLTSKTYILSILNLLLNILQFTFMTNIAIVMAAGKVGNAAKAGMVLTAFTGGAFAAGLLYGRIFNIFKRFTIAISVGLLGISFLILLNVNTYSMYLLAGIIFGLGFGTYNPDYAAKLVVSSDKSISARTFSVSVALQGLGQFVSPIILGSITSIFALKGPKADWVVASVCLLSACVVMSLVIAFTKLKIGNVSESE
ncbi:bacillibactin exporter [Clostridium ragsdalei P11]|uniref:Bacillibactin exporter n=1 Tax=Clostridium ragsdalei P11 TaxID=1353534 RepID=A0A1A6AHW7_9CLOT|nr:MFS transporter [Clostridium ragsdalei]OBR89641.1 bacillibactin exporter [Clostridium ragsdalei P11]